MINRALVTLLAAAALSAAQSRPVTPPNGVDITFLASEGVLLSAGDKSVLIDALFEKYGDSYAVPADSTRAALEKARAPFDMVDLVLVTHRHGDHFHPASVASHLGANGNATLVTSRQVIDSLRSHVPLGSPIGPRLLARTTAPGTQRREVVRGISVELIGLPHTGGRRNRQVEHLGYIVELGGRRVLHTGDAELTEETLAPLRLDTARIDIALLPHWIVTSREGQEAIAKWIRPKQVIAIHLPEGDTEKIARDVRAAIPGAVALTRSLETRRW